MPALAFRLHLACLLTALVHGQTGVRLTRIPELVRLPAAAGSNLLLEAEVDATATEVWLATDMASRDRIPLTTAGERRWQLNLADPRLAAMLPAGRDGGELFVFATLGGTTQKSAAVAWSRSKVHDGKVLCLVRTKAGTTTAVASDGSAWLDAAVTECIELQGVASRQAAVVARLGDRELPLQRRGDSGVWVLDLDASLREHLNAAATIEIEAKLGAASTVFHFAVVPTKLDIAAEGAPLVLLQRRSATVPGSSDWLRVHIDDITMGSTLLHVTSADGATVIAPQQLYERDFVELTLADGRYVLVVDKLVNLLVGDDRAELRIRPQQGFVPDRIGQLIRATGNSEDTFVREGKDYTGAEARQLLVAKLHSHRGPAVTLDEFVDQLASRSSKTGQQYEVRRRDGGTVTMQQWLRAKLREIEGKPGPDKK